MAELVDAPDLGSGAFGVRVQVPLLAPRPAVITTADKSAPRLTGRFHFTEWQPACSRAERNPLMQVNIKDRQEVEATVEVIIPAAEVDKTFTSVLKELAGQVRIPGFRPGKVPPAILE